MSAVKADGYYLTIVKLGDDRVLESVSLDGDAVEHLFRGIRLAESYQVNVKCLFAKRTIDCGSRAILPRELM